MVPLSIQTPNGIGYMPATAGERLRRKGPQVDQGVNFEISAYASPQSSHCRTKTRQRSVGRRSVLGVVWTVGDNKIRNISPT